MSFCNDTNKTYYNTFVKVDGITLSDVSLSIQIGNFVTLTASVLPSNATNKNVTWSVSDNSKVTIVPNGLSLGINAISSGNVTITCTSNEDPTKSASCEVSVMGLPVESIILDRTEITMGLGDSELLYATVLPETAEDKSVTWSNENTWSNTIREYNGHLVIDNKHYGIDTITCTSNENSNIKATCSVRVAPPELYVTDIDGNRSEVVWDEDLYLRANLPDLNGYVPGDDLEYTLECDGRDFTQYTYDFDYLDFPDGFVVINPCQFTKTGDNNYFLSTHAFCFATEPNVSSINRTIPFELWFPVEGDLNISINQNIKFTSVDSIEVNYLNFDINGSMGLISFYIKTQCAGRTFKFGRDWPWLRNYLTDNLVIECNGEIWYDKNHPSLLVTYDGSYSDYDRYTLSGPQGYPNEWSFDSGDVLTMRLGNYEVTRTLE